MTYDRISFLIDKKDIEEKIGFKISNDIFYKIIESGNYMGDELCEYFVDNHLDEEDIKKMVEREKKMEVK